MKYLEVSVRIAAEIQEELPFQVLTYYLGELGFDAFVEEEHLLKAYIQKPLYVEEKLTELLATFSEVQDYESKELEDKNWNKEWEKNYYQPLTVIEGELAVRASFHPSMKTQVRVEMVIDPKMAFGTGNHGTTMGMLQLLYEVQPKNLRVIDMGCGSGILGIYAMKLGASSCTSIDFDEWSVRNSLENATINNVVLDVRHGDASLLKECPKGDLFLANITRNIILQDLEAYITCLNPGGRIQLSGFISNDLPILKEALATHGFIVTRVLNPMGEWVAVLAEPV